MKKLLILALLMPAIQSFGQAAWITPFPATFTQPITLYIDVAQTGSQEFNALKTILQDHPEEVDNVYAWMWQPSDPVAGNGTWNDSNEGMKLTWESDLLFSITFTPMDFFNSTSANFNELGISFLAKLDNGQAYAGQYPGEAKTEDLHVDVAVAASIGSFTREEEVNAFPNPCADRLMIQGHFTSPVARVTISDMNGSVLQTSLVPVSGDRLEADLSSLPAGVYSICAETNESSLRKKIIKI